MRGKQVPPRLAALCLATAALITCAVLPSSASPGAVTAPGLFSGAHGQGLSPPWMSFGTDAMQPLGPTITSVSPGEGPEGTPVVIAGSGFTLVSNVSFNGTSATFQVDSDSQISTSVPSGATSGPVSVTTVDGMEATSQEPFTVTPKTPNIVLILTDDQRYDEMSGMHAVKSEIANQGMTFTNGFVVNPECCPSRTTILTGKYSHGTDVYRNEPPHGGFATFLHEDGTTIATLLRNDGYQTAMVGKYLNGYDRTWLSYVPPGWDTWVGLDGGYYNYTLSLNGVRQRYGRTESDYSTDVLTGYATRFIDSVPSNLPLFLYFAPRPPHIPTTPAIRDRHRCRKVKPLRPPSYNEADVSDKPSFIRDLPPLTANQSASLDAHHLRDCKSLLAADDATGKILDDLARTGRLSNTLIVFASDNGFLFGEHRWSDKAVPYEESIHVPIIVRFDPLTKGHARTSSDLVLNLDFAETFADVAGLTMPGGEGMSLLPLLADPRTEWRDHFLIEHWGGDVPAYCAIRDEQHMYTKYETGEEELYDLQADPYELDNRASDPGYEALKDTMHQEMVDLCRPAPPHFSP